MILKASNRTAFCPFSTIN